MLLPGGRLASVLHSSRGRAPLPFRFAFAQSLPSLFLLTLHCHIPIPSCLSCLAIPHTPHPSSAAALRGWRSAPHTRVGSSPSFASIAFSAVTTFPPHVSSPCLASRAPPCHNKPCCGIDRPAPAAGPRAGRIQRGWLGRPPPLGHIFARVSQLLAQGEHAAGSPAGCCSRLAFAKRSWQQGGLRSLPWWNPPSAPPGARAQLESEP